MNFYLFWLCVGVASGLFCFVCTLGSRRLTYDENLGIQFTSIIVGYLVGAAIIGQGWSEEGGFFTGLVLQIASTEITLFLLRRLRVRHWR